MDKIYGNAGHIVLSNPYEPDTCKALRSGCDLGGLLLDALRVFLSGAGLLICERIAMALQEGQGGGGESDFVNLHREGVTTHHFPGETAQGGLQIGAPWAFLH